MNKIIVKVCGTTGTGKSAIIDLIQTAMRGVNINSITVTNDDIDFTERSYPRKRAIIAELIRRDTVVQIEEVQLHRRNCNEE